MNLETAMSMDPFFGKKGKHPEIEDRLEIGRDPVVDKIFEMHNGMDPDEAPKYLSKIELDVLNPAQIDLMLQKMLSSEKEDKDHVRGSFLNRLIQDSYNEGYNGFILTTGDAKVDCLGWQLKGNSKRKLEVTVKGNLGDWCCYDSEFVSFVVEGGVGSRYGAHSRSNVLDIRGRTGNDCGLKSWYSSFNIQGDTGQGCGSESEYSSFEVGGNAGYDYGSLAKYGLFSIEGNLSELWCGSGSQNSTFITSNKATYRTLKKNVPGNFFWFLPGGNRVVYQPKC